MKILLTVPNIKEPVEIRGGKGKFWFEWTKMYTPPDLSYKILRSFVEFFGTEEIDTDNPISNSGCETCNYGSSYGFDLVIHNATKNNPFA